MKKYFFMISITLVSSKAFCMEDLLQTARAKRDRQYDQAEVPIVMKEKRFESMTDFLNYTVSMKKYGRNEWGNPYLYRIPKLMRKYPHCKETTDKQGRTALLLVAKQDLKHTAASLIKEGVNINHQDNIGQTALMIAAQRNDRFYKSMSVTELLLKHDADPSLHDLKGWSAFMYALEAKNYSEAMLLFEKNGHLIKSGENFILDPALIDWLKEYITQNTLINTKAHYFKERKPVYVESVYKRMNHLLNVLTLSYRTEYFPLITFLVKNGANPSSKLFIFGITALQYARSQKLNKLIELFEQSHSE
jgi:ankyrin repeat protein